jgi:hypothetical protein
LADRFGRRNIILICTALLGLLTLAGTLVTSAGELAALRFMASFFFGAVVPNLVAVTSAYCSRRRRPILVIILFMGYTAGAGGGGSIASALAAQFGWRAAFWMAGLTPLLIVVLLYLLLPESIRFTVLKIAANEVAARLRRSDPALQLSGKQALHGSRGELRRDPGGRPVPTRPRTDHVAVVAELRHESVRAHLDRLVDAQLSSGVRERRPAAGWRHRGAVFAWQHLVASRPGLLHRPIRRHAGARCELRCWRHFHHSDRARRR